MIPEQHVWLVWTSMFLIPWAILFIAFPRVRGIMLRASVLTAPFGLTEPLFVPEYWSPPSLFDLARRTGFDLESPLFAFALGGVAAVIYNVLTRRSLVDVSEKHRRRHGYHRLAVITPVVAFVVLYFLPWNPIYPGILAMLLGGIASLLCRPELTAKTFYGGLLFTGFYICVSSRARVAQS